MTYTENFNLELPSGQDPPDIEVINRNMEKLDNQLMKNKNQLESGEDIVEEE